MGQDARVETLPGRVRYFWEGFRYGLPVTLGYMPVSFAFAVTVTARGLPWYVALMISLTNFTSAGQAAGGDLMLAGAPLPEIGVTVLVINIRYMLMSLSLSQKLAGMPLWKKLLLANGVTDEIFFLAMQKKGRLSGWFFAGLAAGPYGGWGLGTLLGALLGGGASPRPVLGPGHCPVRHVHRHRGAAGEKIQAHRLDRGGGGGAFLPVPVYPGAQADSLGLGSDFGGGGRLPPCWRSGIR